MAQILYPRGAGASTGPVPPGYVEVHRWADDSEVRMWMANQGTTIPAGVGAGDRVYVAFPGAPKPPGTGQCRIEFCVPQAALNIAGDPAWRQIMQPFQTVPVYNVTIYMP